MKTALNIIIAILVLVIGIDIHKNSECQKLNYTTSGFAIIGLVGIIILRIYHRQFVEFLNKPS